MPSKKGTVLVVDDDREMTAIIQKVLVKETYEVLTAENGEEALRVMQKTPVDVIVADWKMPVCDGMHLLEIVQKDFPQASLIMITGFGEVDDYLEAMNRGAFEFLSKPLNIDELKDTVSRALPRKPSGAKKP
jgi:DNA-binding NtrC family response regulator